MQKYSKTKFSWTDIIYCTAISYFSISGKVYLLTTGLFSTVAAIFETRGDHPTSSVCDLRIFHERRRDTVETLRAINHTRHCDILR